MNPRYPIYILSRGRWESRLTSKTLERMHVPYRIVIEEQEYDQYAAVIDPKKILVLPSDFREDPRYAIKDDKGLCGGGIPARNWIWEHSIKEGHARQWTLDDNIRWFYRLHQNKKIRVLDGTVMRMCEDFTDRYENVPMSGMQYAFFCPADAKRPPYYLNTRVYSCILLSNDIPHRWRGKYNEDTDLSLRILKDGYCTLLFNAFLCGKQATMTMKGGNTEEIYAREQAGFDNRRTFAESLQAQHPDVVDVIMRWGRVHHLVNYKPFQENNLLRLKPGLSIPQEPNEYGMELREIDQSLDDEDVNELDGEEDNG